jgi:hypothetical protein
LACSFGTRGAGDGGTLGVPSLLDGGCSDPALVVDERGDPDARSHK